ncbi:MAG: GNAT family N-acetyltransferase [Specibacter sp.]
MQISQDAVQMVSGHDPDAVRESALIWARAKAQRDNDPEPATAEETMPGIRRRLALEGSNLILATSDGLGVGFTLFAPQEQSLEIFYLAVDPAAWGGGIGSRLLLSAENHARKIGRVSLELWVIRDNARAIRAYENYGFLGTGEAKRDGPNGRVERRFLKHIGPQPAAPTAA